MHLSLQRVSAASIPALRLRLDELGMVHGTNERMSVENLDRAAEFYRRLIERAAASGPEAGPRLR